MRVLRYDIGALSSPRETRQGFLEVEGYASRTGVQEYRRADGSVQRELRLPDEVFAMDSLGAFQAAVITDDHPPEGRVTADNAKRLQAGFVSAPAARDGEMVRTKMLITDGELIKKMRAGKTQLSVGYEVDYDPTPGHHPQYGAYDGIQRRIAPNHVAVVSAGRAGPEARVRMDGAAEMLGPAVGPDGPAASSFAGNAPTATFHGDTMSAKNTDPSKPLLDEVVAQLAIAKQRADAAEAKLSDMQERLDAATGRADSAEKRVTDLTANRIDQVEIDRRDSALKSMQLKLDAAAAEIAELKAPERLQKAIDRRVKIVRHAMGVLPGRDTFDGLSDRELMLAVVEKLQGPIDHASDRADAYIEACFDSAVKSYKAGEQALERLSAAVATVTQGGERVDSRTAREKMIHEQDTAWQKPIGATVATFGK